MSTQEITALSIELARLVCDEIAAELKSSQIPGVSRTEVSAFVRRSRAGRLRSLETMFQAQLAVAFADAPVPPPADLRELPPELAGAGMIRAVVFLRARGDEQAAVVHLWDTSSGTWRVRMDGWLEAFEASDLPAAYREAVERLQKAGTEVMKIEGLVLRPARKHKACCAACADAAAAGTPTTCSQNKVAPAPVQTSPPGRG